MEVTLNEKDILKAKTEYTGVHPLKFALWIAMASMSMFFAAFTSAFIVKKGDFRVWENFTLPTVFLYSTLVIVLLSITIHASLICYRKAKFPLFRTLLFSSFLLGCLFLFLQIEGWRVLMQMGLPLTGNLSGSFLYLITSMHGLHIVGGLVATLLFFIFAIRARQEYYL
ncbi:MAG: cytochrome oxidase subunit III [Bacteroidetes bacterium]|nr:cytochrome oxidase subunit III [Bacteroidota bacterium]